MQDVVLRYWGIDELRDCGMRCIFCAVIFTLMSSAFAASGWAGAWCMKKGALYSKLSHNRYFTVYTFDEHGDKERNSYGSTFRDNNITWYNEYGLLDNVTIFASIPYKWLTSHYRYIEKEKLKHSRHTYQGLGDVDLGLKYCFLENPLVLSLQLLTKTAWFYDSDENVPPGNNQNDYELKLLAGKSLWPFPAYCGIELGYRWRTSSPSDEYRYLLEFGMNLPKKFSWRVKLDGIKSVKNADLPEPKPVVSTYIDEETGQLIKTVYRPSKSTSTFSNPSLGLEYDLGKVEFTLGYQQNKHWSLECTYTNYPYGENIATGDQYSFAIVYYFSKD